MRVIDSRQDTFKHWRYEVTCSNCESKLELSAGDLKRVSDFRDGDYAVCSQVRSGHLQLERWG
jgi:hypothetical protein